MPADIAQRSWVRVTAIELDRIFWLHPSQPYGACGS